MNRIALSLLPFVLASATLAETPDWPQWRGENRDGTWEANLSPENLDGRLERAWAAKAGPGYSGPTVAGEHVYLTDRVPNSEEERVLCFDRKTGDLAWEHRYAAPYQVGYPLGPRAAVTISEGKALALGAMGHFHCLDAQTGKVLWARALTESYDIRFLTWGITTAPLADPENGTVILNLGGRPDACLVALDLETGDEKWRALDGDASYSAPRFVSPGGKRQVLAWTGNWIAGINPVDGTVIWQEPFKKAKMVINVPDPVLDEKGERFFLTSFYDGASAYRFAPDGSGVEKLWARRGINERKTEALHSMIMTSVIRGDHVYGIDSYGEFRCLDLNTGERVWLDETLLPKERWATAYFFQNGDVTWMTTETGKLVTGRLTPEGFERISEAQLIEPTSPLRNNRKVGWSHPAIAGNEIFARNDEELICVRIRE